MSVAEPIMTTELWADALWGGIGMALTAVGKMFAEHPRMWLVVIVLVAMGVLNRRLGRR